MHTHARSTLRNPVTLNYGRWTSGSNAYQCPVIEYMCAKFGVDSSSRFSLQRGHTHTHTHTVTGATDHPTQASAIAGVGNYIYMH